MSDPNSAQSYPLKGPYSQQAVTESIQREQVGLGPYPSRPQGGHVTREGEEEVVDPHKNFHLMSLVGLAYAILNSWTAMATSLSVALPSGGPSAVIWGIVPSFIGNLSMAASMAEICHVYPTAGGQYHWSAILSPAKMAPAVSWVCGWFAASGWVALAATAGSLAGQLITGVIGLMHPNYDPERWHIFLIYTAYTLGACFLNIFGLRLLPMINQTAIFWSLTGAVIIIIVCLSCASPNFQDGDFVFREFINTTGWPDGVAWILGLLQSSFGLTGYDAVSHMVEEMPLPHINAPKTMILAVCIGASSSFVFLICLLFSISDVDSVNSSAAGALLESMYQATNSKAGAVCLQIFPIIAMVFTAQGLMTASSRMVYAFARDGGLPFSRVFAIMNSNGVPIPAVLFTTVLVIIFGCIYLGSSAALNAILSSSVVFLNISYSIPIFLVLIRGRSILRPPSLPEPTFTLGPILGPICNVVGLCFTALTTVFFLFPPELPVTGTNMNYAVVVLGIIFIISVITWIVDGRKNFIGPRDLGALLELARSEVDATKVNVHHHGHSHPNEHQSSVQEKGSVTKDVDSL
ncbi:choline transporter, putative [Cryptococcus deneoformans JEC21]|uniref:Choline transporter, putative n=1 Tax=Cryptococcus deneoformans (strain JEC21 / ATCC MYA-565) TaxID=214684 RepID=Q5KH71_CRYD1|nr:choline transporter, putative [Cryptococcus neoformans var. neoformans JEC21]AAW43538.1 choline transporter, putative [Cryptococcus neoformans var. neoformans JEC21]